MSYFVYLICFVGASFILLGGLGVIRMPTLFMRMQATSKASTLGVILITAGVILRDPSPHVIVKGVAICFLLLLTTPVAAHAIAQAAKHMDYDK